jgi:hypothetical protein
MLVELLVFTLVDFFFLALARRRSTVRVSSNLLPGPGRGLSVSGNLGAVEDM